MKKIITLLFFVGFLTSAFAQSHRREEKGHGKNNQSSWQNQSNRGGHDKDFAYNKGWDHGNRGSSWRDRDDRRGYRDHGNWGYHDHGRYERDHRRGSWFRRFHGKHWR